MSDTRRRLQRIAATFNSRARKYHAPGVVTAEMLAASSTSCAYCSIQLDLDTGTWDHVIPLSSGGANYISNIARCCTSCQREKFTKSPEELAIHRGLLVTCPIDGVEFKPRWAEWVNGRARYCSHRCAGKARWTERTQS